MREYVITIVIHGDVEAKDEEGAEVRAREIRDGLRVLASDLGLQFVTVTAEVEEL